MNMQADYGQRPKLEWETLKEFKEGGIYVRVTRAVGLPRFSLSIGSIGSDGERTFPQFQTRWEVQGGHVVVTQPAIDPAVIGRLVDQAKEFIAAMLEKEGRHEKRDFGGAREPQRKGKTERDRSRRRERGHDD